MVGKVGGDVRVCVFKGWGRFVLRGFWCGVALMEALGWGSVRSIV